MAQQHRTFLQDNRLSIAVIAAVMWHMSREVEAELSNFFRQAFDVSTYTNYVYLVPKSIQSSMFAQLLSSMFDKNKCQSAKMFVI